MFRRSWRIYESGCPSLRCSCFLLTKLLRWKEPEQNIPKEPETLKAKSAYSSGLTEDTYQYWSASQDYEAKKKLNDSQWKDREEKLKSQKRDGIEGKKAAIAKLIVELEQAEKALIDAGAKTFTEMHPDIKWQTHEPYKPYQHPEPGPYETTFHFKDPALNDIKKYGYMQIFEAAWKNDLEKIKAITLAPWNYKDAKVLEPPLKIAIRDANDFSPFSIAVLRGHRDLARKIVEICATQYHKDDGLNSRQRWNMQTNADSDDDEYESDDGEGISILLPCCDTLYFWATC